MYIYSIGEKGYVIDVMYKKYGVGELVKTGFWHACFVKVRKPHHKPTQ